MINNLPVAALLSRKIIHCLDERKDAPFDFGPRHETEPEISYDVNRDRDELVQRKRGSRVSQTHDFGQPYAEYTSPYFFLCAASQARCDC